MLALLPSIAKMFSHFSHKNICDCFAENSLLRGLFEIDSFELAVGNSVVVFRLRLSKELKDLSKWDSWVCFEERK